MRIQERNRLLRVGIFVSITMAFLMVFVILLGEEKTLFNSKVYLRAHFKNAENLKNGATVQLKGLKVGFIKNIQFIDVETLEIIMSINRSHAKWIKQDSYAEIKTAGMVGDKFIEILGGTHEALPAEDNSLLKTESGFNVKSFVDKGDNILHHTSELIERLNRMTGKIETEIEQYQTIKTLNETMMVLNKTLQDIERANLAKTLNNLEKATSKITEIAERVSQGPGTLHSLIYDDSAFEDLKVLLGGAQRNNVLKYFVRQAIKKSEEINQQNIQTKD